MATLDTIIEMQKKGMTDYEISTNLQSQGISPKEINDSLNQAKVKSAVNDTPQQQQQNPAYQQAPQTQEQPATPQTAQLGIQEQQPTNAPQQTTPEQAPLSQPQPSITQTEPPVTNTPEVEYPVEQQYPQETYPADEYGTEQYGGGEEYYDQDYYAGQEGGYTDTETITEISEQVVAEKFKEYNRKTGDIKIFKTTIQEKVSSIEQRVKRIEDTIDKLQHAILQKVGEFGENTNMIKKDLENLHNTTSKLMNPLVDNYRELQKLTQKKHKR